MQQPVFNSMKLASMIGMTMAGLLISYLNGWPLAAGFSIGLIYTVMVAFRGAIPWREIGKGMREGAWHTKEVMMILLFVGLLIPAWTGSGTIPYLIQQCLAWLPPSYFLVFCFVSSSIVAMILGTSTGTLSALGIPLVGAAAALDVPLAMCAGALVSGAFVGDRTSPVSSAARLTASSAGNVPEVHRKAIRGTTLAAITLTVTFFLILDLRHAWGANGIPMPEYLGLFDLHISLALPAMILVTAMLLKWPLIWTFGISIATSMVLGSIWQGVTLMEWSTSLLTGWDQGGYAALHTKGLLDMLDLICLIGLAGALIGVLERANAIEPWIQRMMGGRTSMLVATMKLFGFGVLLGMISCTQTLPLMVSGKTVRPVWIQRFASADLSRVVSDTALVTAGLIPWNMLALLCATILDVPVTAYVPYAIFLWCLPLCTLWVSMRRDRSSQKAQPSIPANLSS
ncbi:Na+/H+ antiporter NhaC family protein [Marinicrinis sediminis]|uniref:Na+/H+ antiporter NhaC family protein n=1 Tax=Marinicrinis sediminis TaxID=1652465 RepID=A0ABW5RCD0_9BACL